VLLLKFSSSGSLIWARTWGGATGDNAALAVVIQDQYIYLVGSTNSFGAGMVDVLLLVFYDNGDLLLQKVWGGGNNDHAHDMVLGEYGDIYVTGSTQSFGDSEGDILLLKLGPILNESWARTWGGALGENAECIGIDRDGDIYVAGRQVVSLENSNLLLLKCDSGGQPIWARFWDHGPSDIATDLLVTGSVFEPTHIHMTCVSSDLGHGVLLRYDAAGALLNGKQKIWKDGGDSHFSGLGLGISGVLYIAGYAVDADGAMWNLGATNGAASGISNIVIGTGTVPEGTVSEPTGTLAAPSGTHDTGGGYSDALVLGFYYDDL
jgi:hypothetical protein